MGSKESTMKTKKASRVNYTEFGIFVHYAQYRTWVFSCGSSGQWLVRKTNTGFFKPATK